MQCHVVASRFPGREFGPSAMQPFQSGPQAAWPRSFESHEQQWGRLDGQQTVMASQSKNSGCPYQNRFMAKTSTLGLSSLTSPLNNETTSHALYQPRKNSYSITSYDERVHRQQAVPQQVSRFPGNPMTYTNMHQQSVVHERCFRSHSLSSPVASKRVATQDVGEGYCPPKRYHSGMESAPVKSYPKSAFTVPEPKSPVSDEDALQRYLGAHQALKHPPPLMKTRSPDMGATYHNTREGFAICQGRTYRIPPPLVNEANQQEPDQFISASPTHKSVRQDRTVKQDAFRRYSTSALPQQNNARQSAQLLRRAASYGCGDRNTYEKINNRHKTQERENAFHFPESYKGYNHDHNLHVDNVHQVQHLTQDYRRFYKPMTFHQERNEIQVPSTSGGSHVKEGFFQTPRHKNNNNNNNNLQFHCSTHCGDNHIPLPTQVNLENRSLRNHETYQKTSGPQSFLVNKQGRTPDKHQQKSFTGHNSKTAHHREVSQSQQSRDSGTELKRNQDGLKRNTQSTVLKSKVSSSRSPPPLKRVKSLTSAISENTRPNPEQLQNARSPALIPGRPRSLSVGSKPPPLKRIKDQDQVNRAPEFLTRPIKKNTKENNVPVLEIPNKEKDEQELPDKCGGYAYDHKSLPKIVAVHSFISGDENVLKLIGQQDRVTQTSVTVSMADNGKTVTTGVQTQCHEEKHTDAILNNGCSDSDDEEVVLTKITRNGHTLHSPSSSPRKSGMVDCMCQTTSLSAPTCSGHENNDKVQNHEVATNVTFDSPCLIPGTTARTADKGLQTPNFQSPPRFQNGSPPNKFTAQTETKDLPNSPPEITGSVTSLHESEVSISEEIESGYVCMPQPIKVDSCVQATSFGNVNTNSVAANKVHVSSGNNFVFTQASITHAKANTCDFHCPEQTVFTPEGKNSFSPEEQNCSKVKNRKRYIDTTEQLNSENTPKESIESPKLLKKRPSTEELCRKITNTRERMKNEKIPWKKKVLQRLQIVLVRRLRKTELETGEKASIDIDEIAKECFEMLRLKSTHLINGTKKNEGAKSSKKETECNPQRKQNKHKKVSEVVKGKKKLNQKKNEEALSKENCLEEFEEEFELESGYINQMPSVETSVNEPIQERRSDKVNTKNKDYTEMNSGLALAVDKNKNSSSHSKIVRAKSYPVQNSTSSVRASKFHRQVSFPEDKSKRATTKPRISTPNNGGQIRNDAVKLNSIFATNSLLTSLKKNATSKSVISTKESNNNGVKSDSSKYNLANESAAKQASIRPESQLTNLGETSNRVPKGVQSVYKSSLQPKSDLQRHNAKKISSWGGAIKPQPVDHISHNSLPGGSHAKFNKLGVKRHWLTSSNSF